MVDNVTIPASGTGTATPSVATDDVGGQHYQRVKISDGVADSSTHLSIVKEDDPSAGAETGILLMGIRKNDPAALGADSDFTYPEFDSTNKLWVSGAYREDKASSDLDPIMVGGFKRASAPANTSDTDGDYEPLQGNAGALWTSNLGFFVTCTTDVTRPANTTTYTINDAMADTTPTAGGFTFTNAARKSGGSGIITDLWVTFEEDAGTPLQAELILFDTSVTAVTDNAAYGITDAESKTCVGIIPFTLADMGNQGSAHAQNLSIGYTCVGSANLRFLIRVKNGYVPTTNSSVITFRLKCLQID